MPTPAPRKPQTKPLSMVLGFIWPQNPPPPAHLIGHQDHHHHHLISHTPPPHHSLPPFATAHPEQSPSAWFRTFGPKPPLSHALSNSRIKCHPHIIPHTPQTPTNHLHRRLQRRTLNRAITARFRVSGPQHLPWLAFANASPRDRRRLVRAIPPSPPTSLRRRLTRQNRNRATAAQFRVFGHQPLPLPAQLIGCPDHHHHLTLCYPPTLAVASHRIT